MKLRNKQTGEVVEFVSIDSVEADEIEFTYVQASGHENSWGYRSLEKFNEEWGDYVPAEPLIKNEKIRKAVRAWAEANRVAEARYSSCHDAECEFNARDDENKSIVFIGNFTEMNEELDYSGRTIYAIAELCGEGEG